MTIHTDTLNESCCVEGTVAAFKGRTVHTYHTEGAGGKSHNTIQYNTIQYNTIQYNTIQYNTIQYNTIQYNTIQYNTIQYNTIQYNTWFHFMMSLHFTSSLIPFFIKLSSSTKFTRHLSTDPGAHACVYY